MRPGWLLVLVLVGACAGQLPAPTREAGLAVEGLALAFPADRRGELRLRLALPPSPRGLWLRSLSWELQLEGRRFAVGTQRLSARVAPSGDTVEVVLPLAFVRQQRAEPEPQRLEVRVAGALQVEGPAPGGDGVLEGSLPFAREETLRVRGAPLLQPRGVPGLR